MSGAAGGEGRGGAGRRARGQGTGAVGKGVERSLFSLPYYIFYAVNVRPHQSRGI